MQKIYIIVEGGMVQEIYGTMTSNEVFVEVLDLDGQYSEEEKKELDFMYRAIRDLMYRIN